MRRRFRSILLAASLSALVLSAAAAEPPRADDIVVTGELPGQAQRAARSYVAELGVASGEQPTARWLDPICPRAVGLAPQHAALVEQQIRGIVREVGAPLAKPACRANFSIAFTDGPEQVVQRIARARGTLPPADARELKQGAAPIRWWYNSELRSRDGLAAGDVAAPWATIASPNYTPLPSGQSGNLSLYNSNLVSTQMVRALYSATIIVDVNRSAGLPLKTVVDYAALVGLAEVALGAAPAESILSLFHSGGERALTRRDRAFLTGLYRIPLDRRAAQQRRAIVRAMTRPEASNR